MPQDAGCPGRKICTCQMDHRVSMPEWENRKFLFHARREELGVIRDQIMFRFCPSTHVGAYQAIIICNNRVFLVHKLLDLTQLDTRRGGPKNYNYSKLDPIGS